MQMTREGIRRLLVVSGDASWSLQQAQWLRQVLAGDGIWVGPPAPIALPAVTPGALKSLLGREYRHAFFDARHGFDLSALAALSGTLRAGSWLVLLIPPLAHWPTLADADSLRWSDSAEPVITPNFVHHVTRQICANREVILWQQGSPLILPDFVPRTHWQPAGGAPLRQQAAILASLAQLPPGVAVITAERGRGKSALAGILLRQLAGAAIVTAPARQAAAVMAAFAGDNFHFMAPDALLASKVEANWLIVDEAAAIPMPLLHQLVARFPHTLLTTTVEGYEGTGRGFLLKFCASFPGLHTFSLTTPIRWAAGCPLEGVINQLLLLEDSLFTQPPQGAVTVTTVKQHQWRQESGQLPAMYQLLSGAHYRTSPVDLRRMMDAPKNFFISAESQQGVAGALWLVAEGGLAAELSQAVWAGFRRPRGNLVAQSLAAHGGDPLAATLTGQRITRIAVHPARQREGIGQALVTEAQSHITGVDYLSVSFGYTPELWRFWQRCGFTLVRLGTHLEASSGCYSAMALYPLTPAGHALARQQAQRLIKDEYWLRAWRDVALPLAVIPDRQFTDQDWQEVAGFAFAHRPLLASIASLNRLILQSDLPLPALRARLQQQDEAIICAALHLSGRKALLAAMRHEAQQALLSLDSARAQQSSQQIMQLRACNGATD